MFAKVIFVAAVAAVSFAQNYGPSSYGYGNLDDYKYNPQPYDFGYDTNDGYGTITFRKESGDGNGRVQGSYGYKDNQGLERAVDYVADEKGFRAQVKTNEPGTDNQNPADVEILATPIVVDYAPQKYAAAPQLSYAVPRASYAAQRPIYDAARSTYESPRQSYSATGPFYGALRPSYGATGPSYGALRSSYGALSPSYGRPRSSYGALNPSYGAPRPSYGASRLSYGAVRPSTKRLY